MRSCALVLAPLIALCLLGARNAPSQTTPLPASPSAGRTPFEAVPDSPQPPQSSGPTIETIEFLGAKRVSQSGLRAIIASRVGGVYDIETLHRDTQALYGTGRLSDIVLETEPGLVGAKVRFVVVERPVIQSIEYQGDDSVTVAEILEHFKQRKINLRVETLFNNDELPRAAVTVQELATQRGRRNITVTPLVEPVWPPASIIKVWPPSTVKITFLAEQKH